MLGPRPDHRPLILNVDDNEVARAALSLVPEVRIKQAPRGLACLACPGRPFAAAGP